MDYEKLFKQYVVINKISSGNEAKVHCPFHPHDDTPSLSINLSTGLWNCFGCNAKGNFEQFEQRVKGTSKDEGGIEIIPPKKINDFHEALLDNSFVMEYINRKRLWSKEILDKYRIGWNGYRITVPIKNDRGDYVNIRLYDILHKFDEGEKIRSWKPYSGEARIWPIEVLLNNENVYLFEGESDTLLGLSLGLPAITFTAGAAAIQKVLVKFSQELKNKIIHIVYDNDTAGRRSSDNLSNRLIKVSKVFNIQLGKGLNEKEDFTDYILKYGFKKFMEIVKETLPFIHKSKSKDQEIINVELAEASLPENFNRFVKFKAIVSGKDLVPYLIPRKINFTCPAGTYSYCKNCEMSVFAGETIIEIEKEDPLILELLGVSTKTINGILKETNKIYNRCNSFELEIIEAQNIEELRLIPELTFNDLNKVDEYVVRQAFFTGSGIKTNTSYEFTALTVANPKTQYATHILTDSKTTTDTISNFIVSEDIIKSLNLFECNGNLHEKIDEIVDDLIYNVTKIYERKDLVLTILFTYLSTINFKFLNHIVTKGWVESLIIGDTRTGKTETAEKLMSHFKLGEMATGENVSYAGLIGGIQQVSNRFMISWGKIPLNDRRLLIIDEASSMEIETISQLSGVRSSGIAEITKIQAEKTYARTRLVWISNPRSSMPIDHYDLGISTVKELIGKPEDIARFDLCNIVSIKEVSKEIINKAKHKSIKHVYKSNDFKNLILWCWSRKLENIKFDVDVEKYILSKVMTFTMDYQSDLPIIESADFRLKLARIAIAVATLSVSTKDYEDIIVKKEHVDFSCSFLDKIYSKEASGYKTYAKRRMKETSLKDNKIVMLEITKHGRDFVECLSDAIYIRLSDLEDFADMDRPEAKKLMSFLVKNRGIKRKYQYYVKTPAFITLLKRLLDDPNTKYDDTEKKKSKSRQEEI